ncbi:GNAT family N-acetyltransferase [Bacilli bacterium]|uniref:GNAT family N-acetyltransferase n=1 Tax=Oceanobacillus sp. FSL K6-0118 TaxID=2921418 RepID=UPI0006224D96|nr:acetyltransferase [Bacilli bacterium VT-13-104]PZD84055.1 GNAT family N-acetyltransferase [Bacilli bacterium]PZD84549.1 GNAT family N-acetyltransferase [Bacilli bacterium]PZD86050.1 GNAT family N-acetyltransferase [Bacilli bacterium]RCO04922.1 GNAT family N-acetyltransferase [Bacilli bacterium]
MTIRKATYRETQKILDHSLEVLKEASMGYVIPTKEKARQMVLPFLSNGYYLVSIENNVMKGWIAVASTIDYYTDDTVGIIPELYVLPQYRKQGLSEKLCQEALKCLKEEGHTKVQLNVFSGNHINQLYQKLGFQEISMLMEIKLDDES